MTELPDSHFRRPTKPERRRTLKCSIWDFEVGNQRPLRSERSRLLL